MIELDLSNTVLKETRQGFADALVDIGNENPDVVVIGADVTGSVKTNLFRDNFPNRFFSVGISEQDMIGVAAGLSITGKIPIVSTYGEFATGRPYDQIRQSIAYSEMNVKICASHCGISVGSDGATHQSLEDIALMRVLPNMTVVAPCDYNQTYNAVKECIKYNMPFYIRFYRDKTPNFTDINKGIIFGKADLLKDGSDVTLIVNGLLVWHALLASEFLEKEGISVRVINMHTIKPIDKEAIIKASKETKIIITCEDHQRSGGLFSAVAEIVASYNPVKMDSVAINDTFGESGTMDELMEKYQINSNSIIKKIKSNLKIK